MLNRQVITLIVSGLLFILGVFILWEVKEIFTFRGIYLRVVEEIISQTGLNIWLARAFAALVGVLVTYGIFLSLSITGNAELKRNLGLALIGIVIIGFSFSMKTITDDNLFNPDGTAKQCYTRLMDGSIVLTECSWKVHKVYGTPVMPVNDSVINEYQGKNKALPEATSLKLNKNTRFFSNDGKPLFWYYQHANGKLEFFDHPGHHPQLNTILAPVSPEIVMQFLHYKKSGSSNMIAVNSDNKDVISNLLTDMETHW